MASPSSAAPAAEDLCLSRAMASCPAGSEDPGSAVPGSPAAFSLVSYNILADCHVTAEEYSYTEPRHLSLDFRHPRLMEELRFLDADIICLQEVGPDYFKQRLLPDLQRLGYEGEMGKRKVQDEGEATLYRTARFELLPTPPVGGLSRPSTCSGASCFPGCTNGCTEGGKEGGGHMQPVYLADLASKVLEGAVGAGQLEAGVRKAAEEYLDCPDLVLLARLRCRQTGRVVTIGNVHVIWNRMLTPDVQSVQTACAVRAVLEAAGAGHGGEQSCLLLCGDFNSEPSKPPYQLASSGRLDASSATELQKLCNLTLPDGKKTSLYEAVKSVRGLFDHDAKLTSAFKSIKGREPEVTCYGAPWLTAEVLDYVLYCGEGLGCLAVLEAPSWERLRAASPGLPDTVFPSDHIAQKAVFTFL